MMQNMMQGMMPSSGQAGAPQAEMTLLHDVFQKMLQNGADVNVLLQQLQTAATGADAAAAAQAPGCLASSGQLNPGAAAAAPAAAGYGSSYAAARSMPCARKVARQGAFLGYSGRGAMMSRGGGKGRWKQQAMPQKRISRAAAAAIAAPAVAAAPLAPLPPADFGAGMGHGVDVGMVLGPAGAAGISDADFANLFGDMFE
jgi:hypothetical protein